eukprot:CAMPEP_0117744694 /NCGR_PEP_ID=MMETSP0947-20121206/6915_1 /TAXON_ID=44440 /ORGANISM="Chattonella subsalsa, Strain CCMP2191" /LENGTH=424 /DNA_ID=CAMNT_0005561699 /DNA_START=17 /DNA_END=1288 /DNA_ORIENTATION=+
MKSKYSRQNRKPKRSQTTVVLAVVGIVIGAWLLAHWFYLNQKTEISYPYDQVQEKGIQIQNEQAHLEEGNFHLGQQQPGVRDTIINGFQEQTFKRPNQQGLPRKEIYSDKQLLRSQKSSAAKSNSLEKKDYSAKQLLRPQKSNPAYSNSVFDNEEKQEEDGAVAISIAKPAQDSDLQDQLKVEKKCPEGIKFMMYATHGGSDDRFCRALESIIRHKIPLHVLGWGLKWHGLSQKLEGSLEAVRELPDDCIVIFTDAYDVLYQEEAETIKQKFLDMGHSIVFSAECGCWPHVALPGNICFDKYPKAPTPYRYLNSGQWAAYAAAVRPVLAEALKKTQGSMKVIDQEVVADIYMEKKYDLILDHNSAIFQAMHRTDPPDLPYCNPMEAIKMQGSKYFNTVTKTVPSIFHFNGGGKKVHLPMEKKMW